MLGQAVAPEYFVTKLGNDANDGLSRETAFLTIQRGVDALNAWDTLTIGPGEYFGNVRRADLGSADRDTVIRAEIPGAVLLRGDVPAPEFRKVDGYRFVHVADFDRNVEAVNEVDTCRILGTHPNVHHLEFAPGTCHYDAEHKKLYVSSSDLQDPAKHHYTVSVTPESGLYLKNPKRVIVEGLGATGFYRASHVGHDFGIDDIWGIVLYEPEGCTIRNCVTFLNAGGICMSHGRDNVIAGCVAYGNGSPYSTEGGNIVRFYGNNDVIHNCFSYDSGGGGMRFYATMAGPCVFRDNLSVGNGNDDYWIKGAGGEEFGLAQRCISSGRFHVHNVVHCLVGSNNAFNYDMSRDNIVLPSEDMDPSAEFADPANYDFRLQATSKFRQTGHVGGRWTHSFRGPFPYKADIFYVKPEGDDANDGLSMRDAWKTLDRAFRDLKPGDTLHLAPGVYRAGPVLSAGQADGETIFLRGRGTEPAVIEGRTRAVNCAGVTFERLHFAGGVELRDNQTVEFKNCTFSGPGASLDAAAVVGLKATHCVFAGSGDAALDLKGCSAVHLSGNVYANRDCPAVRLDEAGAVTYSDYNAYGDGTTAWSVRGEKLGFADLQKREQHDRYSKVEIPEIVTDAGVPRLKNAHAFGAGGPNGTALGIYREFEKRRLRLVGPFVHSVSDTTANLEWWTSQPATCEVAWGDSPECKETTTFDVNRFGSFSLTGLRPNRKYYFKIKSVEPVKTADVRDTQGLSPDAASVSFTTRASAPRPSVYYVAPDGDNAHSGASRDQAWRTIHHAAGKVNAGDTVLIAGGTYLETVRVRATGDQGKPVTFKAMPGEKMLMDGGNRRLLNAFVVTAKHHIHFDGLHFGGFNKSVGGAWTLARSGVFLLYRSDHVRISRCLMDGRGPGYSAHILTGWECSDLAMRNSVVCNGFHGLDVAACPDFRVEHCVFLRNLIQACIIENSPDQKAYLRNNIFTDSLPRKVRVQYFELPYADSLVLSNNCYYLRVPDEERKMLIFYKDWGRGSVADYEAKVAPSDSVFCDPQFAASRDLEPVDEEGKKLYYTVDHLVTLPHLKVTEKSALHFNDLFATNPDLVKRRIGLIPEDFKDFHFAVQRMSKGGPIQAE